ncbi:hypothetical protein T492DRAFT_73895 [Pavlovales sp. CCMP2436]|nr:hypothetical protein T492DRAFT_73895 [Pavlovales sp. CCMP2436]
MEFKKTRAELPRIVVLDTELSRAQLAALYREVDGFVLPTRAEGWGLPAMEAMATALPVIVTNHSGPTAFIDESNSLPLPYTHLFPDGRCEPDGSTLEKLMLALVDDRPRARALGRAARRSVVRKFAPELLAAQIERRMREALGRFRLRGSSAGARSRLLPNLSL